MCMHFIYLFSSALRSQIREGVSTVRVSQVSAEHGSCYTPRQWFISRLNEDFNIMTMTSSNLETGFEIKKRKKLPGRFLTI